MNIDVTFKELSAVHVLNNYFIRLYCNLRNGIVHPTVVFKAIIIVVNCLLQLFILWSCIPPIKYMVHYFSCFLITDKNAFTPIKTIHMLFPLNCQHTNVIPNARLDSALTVIPSFAVSKNTTSSAQCFLQQTQVPIGYLFLKIATCSVPTEME